MSDDAADVLAALGAGSAGDDAFARLYDRHASVVFAYCAGRVRQEADEACQETFLRAHRRLAGLSDPARFQSWLLGIARNVCSERRRAAGRRKRREEAAGMNHVAQAREHAEAHTPAGDAAHREELDRLSWAITRLPERQRLALHLFYLDPEPVAAARDALGLKRSAFYKLLADAKAQLAAHLAPGYSAAAVDAAGRADSASRDATGDHS